MQQKKLIFIITFLLIIMCIITILFAKKFIANNTIKNETVNENELNINEAVNEDEYIVVNNTNDSNMRVKNNAVFETIENCIVKYESYVNLNYQKQKDEYGNPTMAAAYKINTEEEKKQAIMDILDEDFVSQNKINASNVLELVNASVEDITVTALKMNKLVDNNIYGIESYSVYAKKESEKKIEYLYYIVKISKEDTFCIYPIKLDKYKSLDDIKINNNTKDIILNDRNKFVRITEVDNSEIATQYLQEYKAILLSNPSQAYRMLTEEYRKRRFNSEKSFLNYVNENKKNIQLMQMNKYLLKKEGNYNKYIITDLFNRKYLFYEIAPREYKVELDDYTIMKNEDMQKYNKLNKKEKAKIQLDNFISKLNSKDYNSIYNSLDSTFKNNNYKNVNLLKKYIKNNFYNLNSIEVKESDSETYEYCVFECKLINMENTEENKGITIIINIKEGTDFTMSFSF